MRLNPLTGSIPAELGQLANLNDFRPVQQPVDRANTGGAWADRVPVQPAPQRQPADGLRPASVARQRPCRITPTCKTWICRSAGQRPDPRGPSAALAQPPGRPASRPSLLPSSPTANHWSRTPGARRVRHPARLSYSTSVQQPRSLRNPRFRMPPPTCCPQRPESPDRPHPSRAYGPVSNRPLPLVHPSHRPPPSPEPIASPDPRSPRLRSSPFVVEKPGQSLSKRPVSNHPALSNQATSQARHPRQRCPHCRQRMH